MSIEPLNASQGEPAPTDAPWICQRNRVDEWRATQVRQRIGPRGWLLSWAPGPRSGWVARLSRPELAATIARSGLDRIDAIDRVLKSAERLIEGRRVLASTNRLARLLAEQDDETSPQD